MRGLRFLVVEDEFDLRMLIRRFIELASGQADDVDNGAAAIEIITSRFDLYDAVLLDMRMPVMNGYETAQELRRLQIKTPIIAITASAMNGDPDKCIEAGCDAYLSKPIDRPRFLEVLASYRRQHS